MASQMMHLGACLLAITSVGARHLGQPLQPAGIPLRPPATKQTTASPSEKVAVGLSLRAGSISADPTRYRPRARDLAVAMGMATVTVAAVLQKPSTVEANAIASGAGPKTQVSTDADEGSADIETEAETAASEAAAAAAAALTSAADSNLWHAMSSKEVLAALESSEDGGLSPNAAANRLAQYGPNELEAAPRPSLLQLIVEQFQDRLVQILLCVALFSAVTSAFGQGEHEGIAAFVEPLSILAILALNAGVGVWQGRSAEGALDALQKLQPSMACVLRDGQWQAELPSRELVPGDVVRLRVGDKVPADCRVLKLASSTLSMDEGSLTGESVTTAKSTGAVSAGAPIQGKVNMVFSGSMVTAGTALGVVVATGMSTEMGTISKGVATARLDEEKTPLGQKLDEFGNQLSLIIGWVCLGVWAINYPRFSAPAFGTGLQGQIRGAIHYLKVAVALGVAAIPEGLPAVITLCLSLGTRRMAQRNVIVRKLPSVETLGCTTVVCTDKTGTLTQNRMACLSVVHATSEGSPQAREARQTLPNSGMADNDDEGCGVSVLDRVQAAAGSKAGQVAMGAALLVEHPVGGSGYSPLGRIGGLGVTGAQSQALQDVGLVCALCNDAELFYADGTFQRTGEPTEAACKALAEKLGFAATSAATVTASSTSSKDSSALGAAYEALLNADGTNSDPSYYCDRASAAATAAWTRVATLEFNRDRKTMSVLVRPTSVVEREHDGSSNNNNKKSKVKKGARANRLLVKGAPDMLLQRCTHMKLADGKVVSLTPTLRAGLRVKIDAMAQRPLRTLGFAVKEPHQLPADLATYTGGGQSAASEGDYVSEGATDNISDSSSTQENSLPAALKNPSQFASVESGLTWVGLTGIKDPARDEVLDAITECKKAGVRVMMITGDSKPTAMAIARDVGIFTMAEYQQQQQQQQEAKAGTAAITESLAFTGAEFFQGLSEQEQLEVLSRGQNLVFCRTEPMDKQKLVKMLSYLGEVPAMTGDGVNDAPALQQAAIGVAMGLSGTEVAKEAADMVLADDNFATIVAAVEEGRCIYNNMQSFICFLISCNFGEIATIFFATLLGLPEPLTPLQLLWVNLVTDGPPATALGFNPPDPLAMQQPPRSRHEPILSTWLLVRYAITGLYVGGATLGSMFWWLHDHGVTFSQMRRHHLCSTGSAFASSLQLHGSDLVQLGVDAAVDPCAIFHGADPRGKVQALALSTLVAMEMLKALSAVSVSASMFTLPPWANRYLIVGVLVPSLLHMAVFKAPGMATLLGVTPLSAKEWQMVAVLALPVLLLEELLKAIGRFLDARKACKMNMSATR